jgi:hypothetical protein
MVRFDPGKWHLSHNLVSPDQASGTLVTTLFRLIKLGTDFKRPMRTYSDGSHGQSVFDRPKWIS